MIICIASGKGGTGKTTVATNLARLWHNQGKTEEARQLLTEIYSWFTEGFETPDLRDARALLDEIA